MALTTCRECGKQISTGAVACPGCGATPKTTRALKMVVVAVSVVVCLAAAAPTIYQRATQDVSPAEVPDDETFELPTGNTACWIMSRSLIAKALKSPSSAVFAPIEEWEFAAIDEHSTRVKGWVESQNPFGVMLRDSFVAIIHEDGDLWKIEYLKFAESDHAFGKYRMTPEEQAKADARREREAEVARNRTVVELSKRTSRPTPLYSPPHSATAAGDNKAKEDSERAELAHQQLIEGMAKAAKLADDARYRKWTGVDGKHLHDAELKSYADGVITVVDRDGVQHKIDYDQLKYADREFVDRWRKEK